MAHLVVNRGADRGCYLELEGRRLRVGDPVWIPLGSARAVVASGFSPAIFVGANCFERVLRVRLADGSVRSVGFDAGVRLRDGAPARPS